MTATPTNRTGRIRPQAVLALVVATILPVLAADRPSTARSSSDDATAAERTAVDDAPGAGSFDVDAVAEDAIGDIESYWSTTFPANFDRPWPPIEGGLHPTDATDVAEHRPPCLVRSTEIVANSYYCEAADALVWDRAMLLDAAAEHGTAGVAAILAHESGHRVHMLLGVDEQAARADPDRYPLALTESMADCHAGAYFRWSVDGGGELRFDGSEVDRAVLALARAHDPVGAEKRTHGGALDRVLAFQRGYAEGVHRCAASTVDELGPATDPQAAPVPHRQLPDLVSDDLAGYFVELAPPGSGQDGPATRLPTGEPGCADAQGAVALCPEEPVVAIDSYEAVAGVHEGIGDHATATLVAGRHALAAIGRLGLPVDDANTGSRTVCLVGAWSADAVAGQGPPMPDTTGESDGWWGPGDLDEAVLLLLTDDRPARDVHGISHRGGRERVIDFALGRHGGPDACLSP
ncbi:putative metalloprotease [Actinoalloteichus hymeniacidonis]|uniref:Metalloprotease n=2 Tax=Actinoalloteichus hymeniacidonis TaxID=340345 RepID=A0AAC9HMX8_9PSEU|nr:hypothetical protein [Actinoalloteichus hymeniacidonis]AOS62322.1 putative metalloprotease [Actinoalloteichus hymeniacidonis]MBB5909650.1 putative metalloprotease [Actinoalloteichus hymeniacidonis]